MQQGSSSKSAARAMESMATPGNMQQTQHRTVGPTPSASTSVFGLLIRPSEEQLPRSQRRKTNSSDASRSRNTSSTRMVIPAVNRTTSSAATSVNRPSREILDRTRSVVPRTPNLATSRSARGVLPIAKPPSLNASQSSAPRQSTRSSNHHDLRSGESFVSTPPSWPVSASAPLHHISLPTRSPDTACSPYGDYKFADSCPTSTESRSPPHEIIEISSDTESSVSHTALLPLFLTFFYRYYLLDRFFHRRRTRRPFPFPSPSPGPGQGGKERKRNK